MTLLVLLTFQLFLLLATPGLLSSLSNLLLPGGAGGECMAGGTGKLIRHCTRQSGPTHTCHRRADEWGCEGPDDSHGGNNERDWHTQFCGSFK